MSHAARKSRALERMRDAGSFPRLGETWMQFMDRRALEDEQASRVRRRVALFLFGLIALLSAVGNYHK